MIFNMDAFKYCFPFQNSLMHELVSTLKVTFLLISFKIDKYQNINSIYFTIQNATLDWFEKIYEFYLRKSEDDTVKKLIEFTQHVYIDILLAFKYYKPIFEA